MTRFDTERTAELERQNAALRAGLESVIDAADSFCDCDGDVVASEVRVRARNALGGQPS